MESITLEKTVPFRGLTLFLLTGLSLWLGWGIRGNFGHEYGAMMPGALAAMAAVLLSGRDDWQPRIAYFGTFGALGWSFGGSISYMQVVGYTHSGHSPSVLYGFACLFVIGFLWAALGGAGTALPALVDRSYVENLVVTTAAVFLLWWLQGVAIEPWLRGQGYSLFWYDTDWVAASLALVAVLLVWGAKRSLDQATSLVLHLALGWWAGFLLLVLVLGLHMTPPRGDNWSGCLGMTAGLLWYCRRTGMLELARATLLCGFIGGIGFAAASMLKLVEITSGYKTNWHSVLEQTTGLFNGVGLAVAIAILAKRSPSLTVDLHRRPWADPIVAGFVALGIAYINLRKNVSFWIAQKVVPAEMAGGGTWVWFDLAYLFLAVAMLALWLRHQRQPLPIVPESWLGKGQLLYLVLLWSLVAGNFERELVVFTAQRLVTEGVLYVVALACTITLLLAPTVRSSLDAPASRPLSRDRAGLATTVIVGLVAALATVVADWAIVRAIHGDRYAGADYAGLNIRFGPNATTKRPK
jgi:hypothetical protein